MSAGFVAALVGFASSFAVVISGLVAVGANSAQAASGLIAAAISMGLAGMWMGWRLKQPVAAAWSTPGAALLVSTGAIEGGFEAAVGAFLITGVLILVAACWKPLQKLVQSIPTALASAMLAGVLLGLCLAPIQALATHPLPVLPVITTWLIFRLWKRLWAVPAAAVSALLVILVTGDEVNLSSGFPALIVITPEFSLGAVVSIAIPLFIVTMASQNLPGFAVLKSYGYNTATRPALMTTGVTSLMSGVFGGHTINLSAIVAALCASEDADPDPNLRYWAAISMGLFSVLIGLLAGFIIILVESAPPLILQTVAGIALLNPMVAAMKSAIEHSDHLEPVLPPAKTVRHLTLLFHDPMFPTAFVLSVMLPLHPFMHSFAAFSI